MLWVKPKPGQGQFVFFYQHMWPELRRGASMSDLVAAAFASQPDGDKI